MSPVLSTVRRALRGSRLVDAARPAYRALRARWLRLRYPRGGFVTGNGVRVFCDFTNPNFAWYDADAPHMEFDKRVIRALVQQSSGSVLIDVGAHFGFYSAVFGEILTERGGGKVIAVEPDPQSFRCLEQTAAQFPKVERVVLSYAISDVDGELKMYKGASGPCLHSYEEEGAELVATVRAASLDTIVSEHLRDGEKIAVIKVDVDGAEPLFFRGAEKTLAEHQPLVFIEFSPLNLRAAGTDPREFFKQLCSGRSVYWLRYQGLQATPVTEADYDLIAAEVANAVTDLVLAPAAMQIAI